MRILVATDQWSPDVVGGSARVAAATSRLRAEGGHEVSVVSPRVAGLVPEEVDRQLRLYRSLRRGPFPQTFSDVFETWRSTSRFRGVIDAVVAHQATTAVGVLAARLGAPLAYVFHASAPLEQRFLRRYLTAPRRAASLALHPSLVLLERAAVRGAAAIFVLSEFSRQLVVAAHREAADRVVLVRGGVYTDVFTPAARGAAATRTRFDIPPEGTFLLSVRRLEPRMGLEELLRAARLLVDRGLEFTLGIAGDGLHRDVLHALAREQGIEKRVRFLGRVSDDDLPVLYAAADLFVLPTVAYEGFGMATMEALASGTPVVGTAVGATPELLRPLDAQLVAPSAAPADLADTILAALSRCDPALRERCAAYAREHFDWRVVIGDWQTVLERTASPQPA